MVNDWPRDDQVLRLDWNAGPRTTVYGRVQFGYENRSGLSAPFGFTGFFPRMASKWETEAISYVNTVLHTVNPTTFVEATVGVNRQYQHASALNQAALDANTRARVLPGFPAFLPEGNPLDLVPNASFAGGIPAAYARRRCVTQGRLQNSITFPNSAVGLDAEEVATAFAGPAVAGADWLEFDSMINLRPPFGNRSRGVDDSATRAAIAGFIDRAVRR